MHKFGKSRTDLGQFTVGNYVNTNNAIFSQFMLVKRLATQRYTTLNINLNLKVLEQCVVICTRITSVLYHELLTTKSL